MARWSTSSSAGLQDAFVQVFKGNVASGSCSQVRGSSKWRQRQTMRSQFTSLTSQHLCSMAQQVDALKLSMQNLTQDVKELQDRGEKGTSALRCKWRRPVHARNASTPGLSATADRVQLHPVQRESFKRIPAGPALAASCLAPMCFHSRGLCRVVLNASGPE